MGTDDSNKTYLGDSVYAEYDGFGVILTTENGGEPSNTIILEPEGIQMLVTYISKFRPYAPTPPSTP